MNGVEDAPLGLLSFLSFGFSVIAAVLAIDMYKLLRTGEFGKTWRLLIIASVMLTLLQVLRMAEILNFRPVTEAHLAQIVELCFVMSLAYAFYVQRKLFGHEPKRAATEDEDSSEENLDENEEEDEDFLEDDLISESPKSWTQYESADISRPVL